MYINKKAAWSSGNPISMLFFIIYEVRFKIRW